MYKKEGSLESPHGGPLYLIHAARSRSYLVEIIKELVSYIAES